VRLLALLCLLSWMNVQAAPNTVEVSPRLVTSGQPDAQELRTLKARGFEAVIYLAPPTAHDAVADEAAIVAGQGLPYINLPVSFDNPTDADFDAFASALKGLGERKVLVHCQINLRASSLVFLYRAAVLKEDPRLAYEAVGKVWQPDGTWKRFIERQLARHRIDFQPF
jgi:protein tyrosine phosphatase (PTP) superfamily phosphohydrolase (DUF442 family)